MRITRNIVPFIDVLFTFLMVFVCIVSLLKVKTDNESASYQQKNAVYLVILNWEGDADLDLWGKDPQGHIVGFSDREGGDGSLMSLNRDCLGASTSEKGPDGKPVNPENEEIIAIRGAVPGEYVFNVHAYALKGAGPTKAHVKLIKNKPYEVTTENDKTFDTTGQEQTFFRFSLDKDGKIVDINELPGSILPVQTTAPVQQPQPAGPVMRTPFE